MKHFAILLLLVLSSTFIYANGPEPWAFYPIAYTSNPVQCYSIRFDDNELKKTAVILYDYDTKTGLKLNRPWAIVEEGKCYEGGGSFLILKKEIIDKDPDILNPVEYSPETNIVVRTWLGNVDIVCPESFKKQNLSFCDTTTSANDFFGSGLKVIPAQEYVGTYMPSEILKPFETMKENEAYMNHLFWTPSYEDPEYRELSPRKDLRKADIGLATCDKRIKINHEIGLKKYMPLSEYPVIDEQHQETWTIGSRTVQPLSQTKSYSIEGNLGYQKEFDTQDHLEILTDFESMGCLNEVLTYLATMRYNYDMGLEPYLRFDGTYFVQPKNAQIKYADYFAYEKLRFETLKETIGDGIGETRVTDEKDFALISTSTFLGVQQNESNLFEDEMNASEIQDRKMYIQSGSVYWHLPIVGLLILAGVVLYQRKK